MTNAEIIEQAYKEAVRGITENMLEDRVNPIWYNYVLELNTPLQAVYTISIMDVQIVNGGFHQYFHNSYGQFASLTFEHLKRIGATHRLDLLERAYKIVNPKKLGPREFGMKLLNYQVEELEDEHKEQELHKLDVEYYKLIFDMNNKSHEEDLENLLGSYLLANYKTTW